jgi:hypothetical protein
MEGIGVRPFVYLIPLLLGAYYVFVTDASSRSKALVGTILLVSFLAMYAVPTFWLLAVLTQVAVGLYIAFYLALKRR